MIDYKPVFQSGGTYTASTQFKVTEEDWQKNDIFYCTAKHAQGTKTLGLPRVNRKILFYPLHYSQITKNT